MADDPQGDGKRWVLVAPPGAGENATLLPARAATPEPAAFIGNQAGGRVFMFLRADDFDRDCEAYRARAVRFVRPPVTHAIAEIVPGASSGRESRRHKNLTVALFEDLYGNLWDLIGPAAA